MGLPESYVDFLKRADPGTAFGSVSLASLGLLGLIGFLLLLVGLVYVVVSFGGKRGGAVTGMACGLAALLALFGSGYAGWAEASATVKAMGAAVTPVDIEDAANRIVGPLLWGMCAFGGLLVLGIISILVSKDDA